MVKHLSKIIESYEDERYLSFRSKKILHIRRVEELHDESEAKHLLLSELVNGELYADDDNDGEWVTVETHETLEQGQ